MNEDKSARYNRLKRRASVLALLVWAGVPALLIAGGAALPLWDAGMLLSGGGPASPLTVALFVLAMAAIQEAVAFPLAYYDSYLLEKRYGLSTQSPAAWLRDTLKAFALTLLVTMAGAQIVFFAMRSWPAWWWAASAGAFAVSLAAIARLFPVLLLPLFYSLRPLERPPLQERLLALSKKAGVPVLGVYEWGLGDKTRRANAALVGTGGTRRVLLSDTLLAEYSDDEIETIMAHELAHHVHGDMIKGLAMECLVLAAAFAAAGLALGAWGPSLGLAAPADAAALPLLVLAGGGVTMLATPIVHAVSRHNERRADRFALTITRQPAAFISAMRRVAAQNLAEEQPSRFSLWFFHSHPPVDQRIELARLLATDEDHDD